VYHGDESALDGSTPVLFQRVADGRLFDLRDAASAEPSEAVTVPTGAPETLPPAEDEHGHERPDAGGPNGPHAPTTEAPAPEFQPPRPPITSFDRPRGRLSSGAREVRRIEHAKMCGLLGVLAFQFRYIYGVAFGPYGRQIATASVDRTARVDG
jgi:hypothetical protein